MSTLSCRAFGTLVLVLFAGALLVGSGCVTQTERRPYRPPVAENDEDVWTEIRREFGWELSVTPPQQEPFYAGVADGLTARLAEWFTVDDSTEIPLSLREQHEQALRRRFEREQEQAMRRLAEEDD